MRFAPPRGNTCSIVTLWVLLSLAARCAFAQGDALATPDTAAAGSPFFSAEDGMLDLGTFMAGRFGFLPVPFPITEPAVGYGGGLMLAFVDKPLAGAQAGLGRPNISMVGGMGTENGTWAAMAADIRYWRNDRLKTLVAGALVSMNLEFGGNGTETGAERPVFGYNMESDFVTLQGQYRLGATRLWAGLRYAYAITDVAFASTSVPPGVPGANARSRVGSLAPSLIYDTRDNGFTPASGLYAELYGGVYRSWLGSDDEFESAQFTGIYYRPLVPRLFLGVRADARATYGEAPFYVLPYVEMRGVPALRYQGDVVAQGEVELRWQCLGRWSLVGFGGMGSAAAEAHQLGGSRRVGAGGVGFRYELARAYQIHSGIDVAWGPDEGAVYFQIGSAWGRP